MLSGARQAWDEFETGVKKFTENPNQFSKLIEQSAKEKIRLSFIKISMDFFIRSTKNSQENPAELLCLLSNMLEEINLSEISAISRKIHTWIFNFEKNFIPRSLSKGVKLDYIIPVTFLEFIQLLLNDLNNKQIFSYKKIQDEPEVKVNNNNNNLSSWYSSVSSLWSSTPTPISPTPTKKKSELIKGQSYTTLFSSLQTVKSNLPSVTFDLLKTEFHSVENANRELLKVNTYLHEVETTIALNMLNALNNAFTQLDLVLPSMRTNWAIKLIDLYVEGLKSEKHCETSVVAYLTALLYRSLDRVSKTIIQNNADVPTIALTTPDDADTEGLLQGFQEIKIDSASSFTLPLRRS